MDRTVMDAAGQAALTPNAVLARLRQGNARFVAGQRIERDWLAQVRATGAGQYPLAAVLGCIDSRVAPEVVFDQGIGEIFSVRVAGNVLNADVLGSLEFACAIARAKLIVVLGHTRCGAVMGACDGVSLGHLSGLLDKLGPAIAAVETPDGAVRTSHNAEFVGSVTAAHVAQTVAAIPQESAVLGEMLARGAIGIAGAIYDVTDGTVTFL